MGGFAIGAALGAAAMFFLGTKKGRRIAKKFHQQGDQTVKDLERVVKNVKTKSEIAATHIQRLQAKGRQAAEKYFQPKDSPPAKKS